MYVHVRLRSYNKKKKTKKKQNQNQSRCLYPGLDLTPHLRRIVRARDELAFLLARKLLTKHVCVCALAKISSYRINRLTLSARARTYVSATTVVRVRREYDIKYIIISRRCGTRARRGAIIQLPWKTAAAADNIGRE